MKPTTSTAAMFLALVFALLNPLAIAGPGHDHGETATQASGSSLPRFAAVSEDLELVGIVNGKHLMLYLDRFTDNSPVNEALIEIDIGGKKYKAQKHGDGEYEVTLDSALEPGVIAITATIIAGDLSDLLAADLELHKEEDVQIHRFSWTTIAMGTGAGLLALMAIGVLVRLRQQARRA